MNLKQMKVPVEDTKLLPVVLSPTNRNFLLLLLGQPTLDPLNPLGPSGPMRPGRPWATLGRLFPSKFIVGNSEEL